MLVCTYLQNSQVVLCSEWIVPAVAGLVLLWLWVGVSDVSLRQCFCPDIWLCLCSRERKIRPGSAAIQWHVRPTSELHRFKEHNRIGGRESATQAIRTSAGRGVRWQLGVASPVFQSWYASVKMASDFFYSPSWNCLVWPPCSLLLFAKRMGTESEIT